MRLAAELPFNIIGGYGFLTRSGLRKVNVLKSVWVFSTLAGMLLLTLVLFRLFQREMASQWVDLATHPQVLSLLDDGGDDLKRLAELDPGKEVEYRQRFEKFQEARRSLNVLAYSRRNLTSRYEVFLLVGLGMTLGLAGLIQWFEHGRKNRRLAQLQQPLQALAEGQGNVGVAIDGRDTVARMARMIEATAQVISQQRERLNYLNHLNEWQEAARRWGHELRTPLTTMYLELNRASPIIESLPEPEHKPLSQACESVLEEIARLKDFANSFSSFASVGEPRLMQVDLVDYASHFVTLFAEAWPSVTLECRTGACGIHVAMDKSMIRQVLMNLCNNSVNALEGETGVIRIECGCDRGAPFLELCDTGPGIPDDLRKRVFEPYVTTRKMGRGMGLGLAISRKIMLEHQGDLTLRRSDRSGTCFRLNFPETDPRGPEITMAGEGGRQ